MSCLLARFLRKGAAIAIVSSGVCACGRPPAPSPLPPPAATLAPPAVGAPAAPAPVSALAPAQAPTAAEAATEPASAPAAEPALDPAAAASPTAPEAAPAGGPAVDPASLAGKLDAAKAVHGGLLITADRKGIHALAPDLSLVAELSSARATHLRVVQSADQRLLYYVVPAKRQLVRLDLVTGAQKVLATLPLLTNECFRSAVGLGAPPEGAVAAANPAADPTAAAEPTAAPPPANTADKPINPLDYIQDVRDFGVDPAGLFACFQVSDRNANMANIIMNFRVDLTNGKTTQRVLFGGEDCQTLVKGKAVTKPLCQVPAASLPRPRAAQEWPFNAKAQRFDAQLTSDSGRFSLLRDAEVVAEQGDYVYLAPFVFDAQTGTVSIVTSKTLIPANLAKLRKTQKLPKHTLVFPGEGGAFWLAGADVLVLGDGGSAAADMTLPTSQYYVISPPATVKVVKAFAATTY